MARKHNLILERENYRQKSTSPKLMPHFFYKINVCFDRTGVQIIFLFIFASIKVILKTSSQYKYWLNCKKEVIRSPSIVKQMKKS